MKQFITAVPIGNTVIWASAAGVDLQPVHPTQSCAPPLATAPATYDSWLVRIDDTGILIEETFLGIPPSSASSPIVFTPTGALLLTSPSPDFEVVSLGPAASEVSLSCIGNAATLANMALAPNEIVSLFGSGLISPLSGRAQTRRNGSYPFELAGAQVTFDGVAAPLLYASPGQINLITPRALQGRTSTHICASTNGIATNCMDMPVLPAAPGIFASGLISDVPINYAIALNQDNTINSANNPAAAGSIVSLFVTGLGAVTPPVPDGEITPWPSPAQDLNVRVAFEWPTSETFFDVFPQILYAGPAPFEVEGLGQINVIVPSTPQDAGFIFGGPYIFVDVISQDGKTTYYSAPAVIWIQ